MMPLVGNYRATVTGEEGRNSWLLWVLIEVKNQQGLEALPDKQRQMETAAGVTECPQETQPDKLQLSIHQHKTLVLRWNGGSKNPEGSTRPRVPLLQHPESVQAFSTNRCQSMEGEGQ